MTTRLNPFAASPEAYRHMAALETYVKSCGLESSLVHLVKMRASQINGCLYCLDMHSREARAEGETEQRLYVLPAWEESALYTPRERAALQWTEALTLIAATRAPDDAYAAAHAAFTDKELADLTLLIGVINTWNRFCVGFHVPLAKAKAA